MRPSHTFTAPIMPTAPSAPAHACYDVVIIGGAMMGAAAAWFLALNPGFRGRVLVVERDMSYQHSSTLHSNSCMRQQFSSEINVKVSQFTAEYIRNFRAEMQDARVPHVFVHPFGYLYLAADAAHADRLRRDQQMQARLGAGTRMLTPAEIGRQFPFYDLTGITAGSYNAVDEGYFDAGQLFEWWRRLARERGVEYLQAEVTEIHQKKGAITGVTLADGSVVSCGIIINAAGPRAAMVARMAGLDLPVEPRKRYTWVVEAAQPLAQDLPLTIDPSGVHMRSDGGYYMIGAGPAIDRAVAPDDFTEDHAIWEAEIWPRVAARIPQFDRLKVVQSWAGHYAYNCVDQNAVLGPHPDLSGFLFMNGFSGHGLQQAPAMGRGLAEWIVSGRYQSLDLSAFRFERLGDGAQEVERAII